MSLLLILAACTGSDPTDGSVTPTDGDPTPTPTEETGVSTEDTWPTDTAPPEPTGTPVSDSFTYTRPKIDVLLVVDASNSMIANTESLSASLGDTLRDWEDMDYDYQAGVIDIDEQATHGHLEEVGGDRWVYTGHPTPGALLIGLVEQVDDPSTLESGRSGVYKALELADEPSEPNYGFLRDGSQIAVIIHSDESDQSGDTPISEGEFVSWFTGLRPAGDVAFHSIVATDDYGSLTNTIGGVVWSVDNTPYGPALQAITDQFHHTVFSLSEPAMFGTLEVRITEPGGTERVLDDVDFFFDQPNSAVEITDEFPEEGATVDIDYLTPL